MRLRPTVPYSARAARAGVKLIYLAALAELAAVITIVVTSAAVQAYVHRTVPSATHAAALTLTEDQIAGPLVVVLLLWLAWAVGWHDWARVVLLFLCGLSTVGIMAALAGTRGRRTRRLRLRRAGLAAPVGRDRAHLPPKSASYYGSEPAERLSA